MRKLFGLLTFLLLFVPNLSAQGDVVCPGALPPRLVSGQLGRVLPGPANNVREFPNSSAALSGSLPGGSEFMVFGDAECSDGMLWWFIESLDSLTLGWTAEGANGTYWLEPVAAATIDLATIDLASEQIVYNFSGIASSADKQLLPEEVSAFGNTPPRYHIPIQYATGSTVRIELGIDLSANRYTLADVNTLMAVIRRRLGSLPVSNVNISMVAASDGTHVIVELQNVRDDYQLVDVILPMGLVELVAMPNMSASTAQTFVGQAVATDLQAELGLWENSPKLTHPQIGAPFVTILTGDSFIQTEVVIDPINGSPTIQFSLPPQLATEFEAYTRQHLNEILAIVVDGVVISTPVIQSPISNQGAITGMLSEDEARDLNIQLQAGRYNLPVQLVAIDVLPATLATGEINEIQDPEVFIFPIDYLAQLNPTDYEQVTMLQNLLQSRAPGVSPLPFLPNYRAGQVFVSNVEYLETSEFSGVRYITAYAQDLLPIANESIFYTYQAISRDGRYYLSAMLPVATDSIPDTVSFVQPPAWWDTIYNDTSGNSYRTYLAEQSNMLNALAPSAFSPCLTDLDAALQTMSVTGQVYPLGTGCNP